MKSGQHKTLLAAAVAACIVAAILFWIFFGGGSGSESPEPNGTVPLASTGATSSSKVSVPAALNQAPVQLDKEQELLAAYSTPIAVYGSVVDQDQNPVQGAIVEIGIADKPLETSSSYTRTTDEKGRFSLNGVQGIAFSVTAEKAGYYSDSASTAHRNVVVPSKGDAPQPTEAAPLVLVLHKEANPVPLIVGSTGQIDIPRSGSVSIDVTSGKIGSGNIQISSMVGDASRMPFDWQYEISVPGGGIVKRIKRFDFQAPSEGYNSTETVHMPSTEPRWSASGESEYFAKLPDGRYSRFLIRFYPGENRNFVVLESYTNPTPGDRNLEFSSTEAILP